MLRLGLTERGVTEILGLAEHVTSIAAAAEGLRLRPDVPDAPAGPPSELVAPRPDAGGGTLDAIREWSREHLGVDRVPAFWSVFASRPRLLDAVWAKHRLVLSAGELAPEAKVQVGLAVAMARPSPYWTGYFTALGRHAHALTDEAIVETAAAVLHIRAFNTIAHGMMLEAPHRDIVAAEFAAEAPARAE